MKAQVKKEIIELVISVMLLITVTTVSVLAYQHYTNTNKQIQELELIMKANNVMQSNKSINE